MGAQVRNDLCGFCGADSRTTGVIFRGVFFRPERAKGEDCWFAPDELCQVGAEVLYGMASPRINLLDTVQRFPPVRGVEALAEQGNDRRVIQRPASNPRMVYECGPLAAGNKQDSSVPIGEAKEGGQK